MNELERAASNELLFSYASLSKETFRLSPNAEFTYDRNAMLNMFRKGAEWQSNQSPWISVKERLPKSDDDLYIALNTKMNPPEVNVCEFDVKSKRWTDSHLKVVHPTHWMPIPE